VLAIEPRSLDSGQKELRAVGVGTSIGHGEDTGTSVLQGKVLVSELLAVDGLSTSSVVVGEVSALAHEVGNDAMKGRALEAKALLAGAESAEVFSGAGNNVRAELHDDTSDLLAIGGNIEKDSWKGHFIGVVLLLVRT